MAIYTVEEWTEKVNEGAQEYYRVSCPHGCEDGDCEGHYEDKDRLFSVTNLFDRHDDDGAGYFSESRARLIASLMEALDPNPS